MHLEVVFRNLKPRQEIRRRAEALYGKVEHFLDAAATAQLTVLSEHGAFELDLVVTTAGQTHQFREDDTDLRTALDRVFHRAETALRRAKERRIDRFHEGTAKAEGFVAETA